MSRHRDVNLQLSANEDRSVHPALRMLTHMVRPMNLANPMGTISNADRTAFHPYFSFKDIVTVFLFFIIFTAIVFYAPDKLGPGMAVLFCKRRDNYNTVCLNYFKLFRTHDINVIIKKILLFLVKIETLIMYKIISRKPYFLMNYKASSETLCVNTYSKIFYFN